MELKQLWPIDYGPWPKIEGNDDSDQGSGDRFEAIGDGP